MFSNKETKEIFWYEIKKSENKMGIFLKLQLTYDGRKSKIQFFYKNIMLIFHYQIFGPDFFIRIFENLRFESF